MSSWNFTYSDEYYDTKKFSDIYPDVTTFLNLVKTSGLTISLTNNSLTTLYYLLYARYGNSHFANLDENQCKYKLYSIIFQYGPTWEKNIDIQSNLRALTEDELMTGSRQIADHAYNPSTVPEGPNVVDGELESINEQNRVKYKKNKTDAYSSLMVLLEKDVSEEFINKFKKLFLTIVAPYEPLFYITEEDN